MLIYFKVALALGIFAAAAMFFFRKQKKDPYIDLRSAVWSAKIDSVKGFGLVYVHIEGGTDAETLTIRTNGTGDIYDAPVPLDAARFDREVCYMIAVRPQPGHDFECSTELTAWKGAKKTVKKIRSGTLKFER